LCIDDENESSAVGEDGLFVEGAVEEVQLAGEVPNLSLIGIESDSFHQSIDSNNQTTNAQRFTYLELHKRTIRNICSRTSISKTPFANIEKVQDREEQM